MNISAIKTFFYLFTNGVGCIKNVFYYRRTFEISSIDPHSSYSVVYDRHDITVYHISFVVDSFHHDDFDDGTQWFDLTLSEIACMFDGKDTIDIGKSTTHSYHK